MDHYVCIHPHRRVWLELQGIEKDEDTGESSDLVALSLNLCRECAIGLVDDFTRATAQVHEDKRVWVYGTSAAQAAIKERENAESTPLERRALRLAEKQRDIDDQLAGKGWGKEGDRL